MQFTHFNKKKIIFESLTCVLREHVNISHFIFMYLSSIHILLFRYAFTIWELLIKSQV